MFQTVLLDSSLESRLWDADMVLFNTKSCSQRLFRWIKEFAPFREEAILKLISEFAVVDFMFSGTSKKQKLQLNQSTVPWSKTKRPAWNRLGTHMNSSGGIQTCYLHPPLSRFCESFVSLELLKSFSHDFFLLFNLEHIDEDDDSKSMKIFLDRSGILEIRYISSVIQTPYKKRIPQLRRGIINIASCLHGDKNHVTIYQNEKPIVDVFQALKDACLLHKISNDFQLQLAICTTGYSNVKILPNWTLGMDELSTNSKDKFRFTAPVSSPPASRRNFRPPRRGISLLYYKDDKGPLASQV